MVHELLTGREPGTEDWLFVKPMESLEQAMILAENLRLEKCPTCVFNNPCFLAQAYWSDEGGASIRAHLGSSKDFTPRQVERRNC